MKVYGSMSRKTVEAGRLTADQIRVASTNFYASQSFDVELEGRGGIVFMKGGEMTNSIGLSDGDAQKVVEHIIGTSAQNYRAWVRGDREVLGNEEDREVSVGAISGYPVLHDLAYLDDRKVAALLDLRDQGLEVVAAEDGVTLADRSRTVFVGHDEDVDAAIDELVDDHVFDAEDGAALKAGVVASVALYADAMEMEKSIEHDGMNP